MMLLLQSVWLNIQEICGLIEYGTKHETETMPAVNWTAVYKTEDEEGVEKRPLIGWFVTYCDDVPVSAVGLVFVDNKPSFVEPATEHPRFVGYERLWVQELTPHQERHYESFNEWG